MWMIEFDNFKNSFSNVEKDTGLVDEEDENKTDTLKIDL